jgi:hypothetical protein
LLVAAVAAPTTVVLPERVELVAVEQEASPITHLVLMLDQTRAAVVAEVVTTATPHLAMQEAVTVPQVLLLFGIH